MIPPPPPPAGSLAQDADFTQVTDYFQQLKERMTQEFTNLMNNPALQEHAQWVVRTHTHTRAKYSPRSVWLVSPWSTPPATGPSRPRWSHWPLRSLREWRLTSSPWWASCSSSFRSSSRGWRRHPPSTEATHPSMGRCSSGSIPPWTAPDSASSSWSLRHLVGLKRAVPQRPMTPSRVQSTNKKFMTNITVSVVLC